MAGVEFLHFRDYQFWILFLSQNGMSLWQIGLLESIFHATSLLCEIPSGMLADRYSYKTNLYLSRIAGIVSSILMLAGQGNFWIYALAMAVSALSYNFDSGTSAAMVYDSAVEAGLKERYLPFASFLSGVQKELVLWGQCWPDFCPWPIAPDLLYHDCDFYHSSFPDLDAERT